MMKKIGIIVGASPIGSEKKILFQLIEENEVYIIAADGGMKFLLENDIKPDLWMGDMDSVKDDIRDKVEERYPELLISSCSPIKDDTDTALALYVITNEGIKDIHVFGGMGGRRPEHSIANIQLMHHYALRSIKVFMYSENSSYYVISNSSIEYEKDATGYISVFSLSDVSKLKIEGLFYEYEGELSNSYALGVSNEFCGKKARIAVENGVILIIQSGKDSF